MESDDIETAIDLEVNSVDMKWIQTLKIPNVIVREKLPRGLNAAVATERDTTPWKHLQNIVLSTTNRKDIGVELLIGLDTPQALEPLEIIGNCDGTPFTVRTLLGWAIHGPVR